jgi:hypothetical protein
VGTLVSGKRREYYVRVFLEVSVMTSANAAEGRRGITVLALLLLIVAVIIAVFFLLPYLQASTS